MGPNPQFLADLVTFTEEIFNMENLIFCAMIFAGLSRSIMPEVFKSNNNLRGGIHIENHIMENDRILEICKFILENIKIFDR